MNYPKIAWNHHWARFPVEILSELDQERYEMRKIERFRDGRIHLLGPEGTLSEDDLAEKPMSSEERIAAQPEFKLLTSKEQFEGLWHNTAVSIGA